MSFRSSPRFGYSNQFSDLFDDEKAPDYIVGLTIVSLILACFFLCWFIFLLLLMCMGKNCVGFLSGAPYDAKVNGQPSIKPTVGRAVFGISGLVYIVFAFLLIFNGIGHLETTTEELGRGAQLGADIFTDSYSILTRLLEFAQSIREVKRKVVVTLQDVFETTNYTVGNIANVTMLPEGYNGTLVNYVDNYTDALALADEAKYIFDGINLKDVAEQVVAALTKLDEIIDEKGPNGQLRETVLVGEQTCTDVSRTLTDVQLRALQIFFGVIFTVVPLFMLLLMGATAAGFGDNNSCKTCLTAWVVLPLFAFFTLFIISLTMASSITAILNADFCLGGETQSPDETVLAILNNQGVPHDSLKYRTINYVVNGCDLTEADLTKSPLQVFDDFMLDLENITAYVQRFGEQIAEIGVEEIGQRLRTTELPDLEKNGEVLAGKSTELFQLLGEVLELISCIRLYEVYDEVIHKATCTTSWTAWTWIFSSFLVISASGMLMMTFRSVLYPVIVGDFADDYSWNQVKEREMEAVKESPIVGDNTGDVQGYTVQTGLEPGAKKGFLDDEAPMGGTATAAYQAVGDDNPFADDTQKRP